MSKPPAFTSQQAIDNAIRLLEAAGDETNLGLMEQLTRAAEIWVQIATHLRDSE